MGETVRLKFLCSRGPLYGANEAAESYRNEGVRFLRTTDIADNGELTAGGVFIDQGAAKEYLLGTGDILVSRSGTLGRCFVYDAVKHGSCAYAGYLVRFVPTRELNPRFFFYLTKSNTFSQWLDSETISSTIGNVNGQKFANMPLPALSRSSQDGVVDFLDRETAKIDRLIANKAQLLTLVEERLSARIETQVAAQRGAVVPLKRFIDLLPGYAFSSEGFVHSPEDGVRLLRGVNVSPAGIRWDDTVWWAAKDSGRFRMYELAAGDIVFGMDRPWIGEGVRVARLTPLDVPALLLQRVARIRARPGLLNDYLFLVLRSAGFQAFFEPELTGVSVPHISPEQIGSFRCVIPSRVDQQRICAHVRAISEAADERRHVLIRSIEVTKEYRSALITAAVTGQIDVRHHAARLQ